MRVPYTRPLADAVRVTNGSEGHAPEDVSQVLKLPWSVCRAEFLLLAIDTTALRQIDTPLRSTRPGEALLGLHHR
jgi:hypothetical protein